jgi:preprotein translocase subunit SecG
MRLVTINATVDLLALIVFIPSFITGAVLLWVLPSGGGGFQGGAGLASGANIFLGLSRQTWVNLHNVTSMIFTILLVLHLILHWRYFRRIDRCFRAKKQDKCLAEPETGG